MKRTLYIVLMTLLFLLVGMGGTLFLLMRSSRVQTKAVQMLTEQLSRGLNADVHIDRVSFHFLNRLQLDNLYVGDRQGDTLLWIPRADVHFNPFALREDYLDFPLVQIIQPHLYVQQDEEGTNLDFLVRAFAPDRPSPLPYPIHINKMDIEQGHLRYRHIPSAYDIEVQSFDIRLRLPWLAQDSVRAVLDGMNLKASVNNLHTEIEGVFHGSPDTVYADQLSITYRGERLLLGQVRFARPLDVRQMQATVDCQDLYANRRLLQSLLSDLQRRPVQLPAELDNLGDVHYRGKLQGHLDDLVLHGAFLTRLGALTTDCRIATDTMLSSFFFNGKLDTKRFQIGKLLNTPDIGPLSLGSDVRIRYGKDIPLRVEGKVHVRSIPYKGYTYRDLHITGQWQEKAAKGEIDSDDPNIDFTLQGEGDFGAEQPFVRMALRLDHLHLQALQWTDEMKNQDMQLQASMHLTANGQTGPMTDRLNGELQIDSLYFTREQQSLLMQSLRLTINNNSSNNSVRLQSDFVSAGINGSYRWSTLPATLQGFAHTVFPEMVPDKPAPHRANDLDFYCYWLHADSVLHVLSSTGWSLPERQTLKGYIHESTAEQGMQMYIPALIGSSSETTDITLSAVQQEDRASMALSLMVHPVLSDSARVHMTDMDFNLFVDAGHDSLQTRFLFGALHDTLHHSQLLAKSHLTRYAGRPFVGTHIVPSTFYLRDTVWQVGEASIEYAAADTALTVNRFRLESPSQYIYADGVASPRMSDSLRIELQKVNLNYILRNFKLERAISADGDITGWATLYALFSTPMLEANLHMDKGYLNYTLLGALDATARLDRANKHILIDAVAKENDRTIVDLNGRVIPQDKYWELYMQLDSTDMNLINYWTHAILQNISGRASGDLHVFGKRYDTWVTGHLLGTEAQLTVPVTGVRYTFTDSVLLDTAAIRFPHVRFRDSQGHNGLLVGRVTHDRFMDFQYDLQMDVSDMQVVNLPYSPRTMFYGTVYATGDVHLYGDEHVGTFIDINGQTRGKTDFYLNPRTASEATDNSFISFRQVEEDDAEEILPIEQMVSSKSKTSNPVYMNLNMSVTPTATVHLLFDPRNGDGIYGQGEGDLRLRYESPTSDVQLYGTYTLRQGLFTYSIGNLIHRDFNINDGSTIIWSGNPMDPVLSVAARYHVTASLRDLFGSDASQLSTNRSSAPVDCMVFLTDRLSNPTLHFGIELPQSDESVASQVKSVINSDEMLMRQIVYLLVFNRFFTPEYLQNTTTGANETYALLSSTITGQINSWLARLTDVVTIGFNFRTDGEGSSASQEYETLFQLHPVSRLTINGNVGYRYNDLSNRPFFGDVDIEYELTEDGKLRIKGFTHTVDKYSLKQANTVQGVGLLFRHDFN